MMTSLPCFADVQSVQQAAGTKVKSSTAQAKLVSIALEAKIEKCQQTPKNSLERPRKDSLKHSLENHSTISLDPAKKIQHIAATIFPSFGHLSMYTPAVIGVIPSAAETEARRRESERGVEIGRGRGRGIRGGGGGRGRRKRMRIERGDAREERPKRRRRGQGSNDNPPTIAPTRATRSSGRACTDEGIKGDEDNEYEGNIDDSDSGDPLIHPSSKFTEGEMSEIVTYQSFLRFPNQVQDAFVAALPTVIKEQELYVSNGTVTEVFFTSCPAFSKALDGWQRALGLGKFTKQYAADYDVVRRSFETKAEWKSDNFEQYYGEKAIRKKERSMSPGKPSKISLIKIGSMRGIQVGDWIRYRRVFDFEDFSEHRGAKVQGKRTELVKRGATSHTKTRGKADLGTKEKIEQSEITATRKSDTVNLKTIEVDMLMEVVEIKKSGKPCIQFELKRAPAEDGETEAQYQNRVAVNPIYEVDTAKYLESLCLKRDGRIPLEKCKQGLESCRYFDVIRGTSLVGSLFAIQMDVYGTMLMDQARRLEEEKLKSEPIY